ncbi:unnamed protein product [Phytophthora fragariaefolia]|uniref:Unnamed protein product n=1 Tax=Phytophthora fragariaefolia TaxID=1490495 RepID=A0A9W6XTQ1_9STRA|nr:unnamed protein product [Phytophthora fragariaefolia]
MNITFRFVALLFLIAMQTEALVNEQHTPRPKSIGRHLQREENKSATVDFLPESTPEPLKDQAQSDLAVFIASLATSDSTSIASPFYLNWTTASDRTTDSDQNSSNGDVNVDPTPAPNINSTSASASFGQTTGSASSSDGELESTIGGDVNMADGEAVPSNLTPTYLTSGIAEWTIVVIVALTMAN